MGEQNTAIHLKRTINCRGKLIDLTEPKVMGILNVTPDSFYDGGTLISDADLLRKAEAHLNEGATFLDLGAVSTKPGAADVSEAEERTRLLPAIEQVLKAFPDAILSVDTFRSSIAREAIEAGATIINDISGGMADEKMFATIAKLQVPYILMHMQGTPQTMQENPTYEHVVKEVLQFFIERTHRLTQLGVHDIIVDPGFGFGKTVEHNFELLKELKQFQTLSHPILIGVSRKSMVNKVIASSPENALNGTSVLNTMALERGASILRVHDVKEAVECIQLVAALRDA